MFRRRTPEEKNKTQSANAKNPALGKTPFLAESPAPPAIGRRGGLLVNRMDAPCALQFLHLDQQLFKEVQRLPDGGGAFHVHPGDL